MSSIQPIKGSDQPQPLQSKQTGTFDIDTVQTLNYKLDLDKVVGRYTGRCISDKWDENENLPLSGLDGPQNRLFHAELTNGRYPRKLPTKYNQIRLSAITEDQQGSRCYYCVVAGSSLLLSEVAVNGNEKCTDFGNWECTDFGNNNALTISH